MVVDPDKEISQLFQEVKDLFGGKGLPNQPAQPAQTNDQPVSTGVGEWQAPIHGTWHNLGGFDPSAARYDDLAKNPKATKGRGHMGVDLGAAAGTPVYSIGPGVVSNAGTDPMGGNVVGINHPDGTWSYYAHLSTAKVHAGDKVDQNTIIGTVGNTGNPGNPSNLLVTQEGGRTWPHLHFGVKVKGQWVDPARYFSIPKYDTEYAKNPGKFQKFWLNDQAKQEAQSFSMKEHNQNKRVAFSRDVERLMVLANQFYKLSSKR